MKKILRAFLPVVAVLCVSSLAYADVSEENLQKLTLGMKNEQVTAIVGEPESIQPQGQNTDGKAVESWQYTVVRSVDVPAEGNSGGSFDHGDDSRFSSRSHTLHSSSYPCSLVMAGGVLVRIQRQEPPPDEAAERHSRHRKELS